MNFIDTLKSVELVLASGDVPLVVGESGIGKTALAKKWMEFYCNRRKFIKGRGNWRTSYR